MVTSPRRALAGAVSMAAALMVGFGSAGTAAAATQPVGPAYHPPFHTPTPTSGTPAVDQVREAKQEASQPAQGQPQVSIPGQPPATSPQVTTNAPNGTANAAAVRILKPVDLCIGCTATHAGDDTSAKGTALRILGQDVAAGSVTEENDTKKGKLIEFPSNPIFDLAIGYWAVAVEKGPKYASSDANSALLKGDIGKGDVVELGGLESQSGSWWTAKESRGESYSNGLHLNFAHGRAIIVLLHSEADSDGNDHSWLIGVGDKHFPDAHDSDGKALDLKPILKVILLQANADGGGDHSGVGKVTDVAGTSGEAVGVITTDTIGQGGGTALQPPSTVPIIIPRSGGSSAGTTSALTVPTAGFGGLIGLGITLLALGALVIAYLLRRRVA